MGKGTLIFLLLSISVALLSVPGNYVHAQETSLVSPQPVQDIVEVGENIFDKLWRSLNRIFLEIGILLADAVHWVYNLWQNSIWPWLQNIWGRIINFLATFFADKMPAVTEEFQREVQELQEEIPQLIKNLWQWLKGLIGRG